MGKGTIRKVFPGGNTSRGFHSFYDHILQPDADKIFVVKGGPGVGKSTFMRHIGTTLVEHGYDVEFHCCSSDNGSLDGICVPALEIAVIDGTAPHMVDPRNPGVVDEIIHLGDYWNEAGIRAHREPILRLNAELGRLFRRAYAYLAAARLFLDEVESYYQNGNALKVNALNQLALQLMDEIFGGRTGGHLSARAPRVRRLFASAITPDGPVHHLHTLVGALEHRYIINGDDGTGKTTLVARLLDAAVMRGYPVEAFHCALDPARVDHLIIPALGVAVINGVEPHIYQAGPGDRIIDTNTFVAAEVMADFQGERQAAREMYRLSFDRAVGFLAQAKRVHDEMERYYVPNMNFGGIDARRAEVLARILELASARRKQAAGEN